VIRMLVVMLLLGSGVMACKMKWKYEQSASGCLMIEGEKRNFRYFMPKHAKGVDLPLIIGLHGGGGKPKRFESYSRFSELSEQSASFIAVYPAGEDKHWNDGRPDMNEDVDDVGFISQLIELIPHVDKKEVYVVGMSNGGLMTQRLACELDDKIKGIAVVGATMSKQLATQCTSKKPLKALFFFGDKDTAFLDNGQLVNPLKPSQVRGEHIGMTKTLARWQQRNRCQSSKLTKEINALSEKWGKAKDDGTVVKVYDYQKCQQAMRYYAIPYMFIYPQGCHLLFIFKMRSKLFHCFVRKNLIDVITNMGMLT
jgi:polyhydroxybutyrate depolymerase